MNTIPKILLPIIVFISALTAQADDLFTVDRNYTHYTVEDGLPENSIRCLEEDQYGVVWICTNAGLARFDGYQFETIFDDIKGNRITNYNIRDILIDGKRVFIGTEKGLYILDQNNGKIKELQINDDDKTLRVYSIQKYREKIFFSTSRGFYEISKDLKIIQNISDHVIRNFTWVKDRLFISSIGIGVQEYSVSKVGYKLQKEYSETSSILKLLYKNNHIYLATNGNGLIVLDTDLNKVRSISDCDNEQKCLPSKFTTNIKVWGDSLFIATRKGLVSLDTKSLTINKYYNFSAEIRKDYITDSVSLVEISKNYIWVGFNPGGVLKYKRHIDGVNVYKPESKSFDGLDNGIYSIFKERNDVYIGTYNGLHKLDHQTHAISRVNVTERLSGKGLRILSICSSTSKQLQLSTNRGAKIYDIDNNKVIDDPTSSNYVTSHSNFCTDKEYYFAQGNNISNVQDSDKQVYETIEDLRGISTFIIKDGLVIVGAFDGLYVFEIGNENKLIFINMYLDNELIYDLVEYNERLLIITDNQVYELFDNHIKYSSYSIPEELKFLKLYSAKLIGDNLWLTTNQGIIKLNADGNYNHYVKAHGIGDVEFNIKATYYDEENNMFYAGGLNNVTAIDIAKFTKITWPNPNVLSKVTVYDQTGQLKQNIFGRPTEIMVDEGDSIVLELGHLDSVTRSSANFFYTVDKQFSNSKVLLSPKERSISFANIANDDFVLGIGNSNDTLSVQVTPYVWKRWWAYAIYGVLITCIFLYWLRHKNNIRRSREAETIARRELTAKRNQLASLSHELRTPLNSIIGIIEGANSLDKDAKHINSSAYLLRSLIDNMLNNIAMEVNDELVIIKSKFACMTLLDECAEIMRPYLNHANIELVYALDKAFPEYIETDRTKLQQVIINLIKNSIKHGVTTTSIHITGRRNDTNLDLKVSDNGLGIAEIEKDNIFDAFSRGDENKSGFGLGLYISKVICRELEGDLVYDSEDKQGASFIIQLPLSICCESVQSENISNDKELIPVKSILIFEDDPLNIHALKLLIAKAGIKQYKIVSSLKDFQQEVANGVDVIVLDLNLGIEQSGIDLAKELKQANYPGEIYMLSAESDTEIKRRALKYVQDYLTKPISVNDLKRITAAN